MYKIEAVHQGSTIGHQCQPNHLGQLQQWCRALVLVAGLPQGHSHCHHSRCQQEGAASPWLHLVQVPREPEAQVQVAAVAVVLVAEAVVAVAVQAHAQ
jgi:hypothetical protein